MNDEYLTELGIEFHQPEGHLIEPTPECDFDWFRHHEFQYNMYKLSNLPDATWAIIPLVFCLITMIFVGMVR